MKTFSADEFKNKFGEQAYNAFGVKEQPQVSALNPVSNIEQAFQSGVGQMKKGFQQARDATNPLQAVESGLTFGGGAIGATVGAALAPITSPTIGKAVDFAADKISNVPAVQKFAMSDAGKNTARAAEDTGNLAAIAGTAMGAAEAPKVISGASEGTGALTEGAGDLSKQLMDHVKNKVSDQPAKIMQRVARIPKGRQSLFEKTAGESVGNYLVRRGIYGNIDEISTRLYDRFNKSKTVADNALAQLRGEFQSAPVKTALDDLLAREERVSSEGAPSPNLSRVRQLDLKFKRGGLNMSEINEVKRLYERNVKTDYLKQNLPESVAKSTNLDTAIRKWQLEQAKTLGLKNLDKINRETRLAKQLLDDIGKEYSGQAGNNAFSLTDAILVSGGDPAAISMLLTKKTFGSKAVQSAIAKALNKGKPVMGDVGAEMGYNKILELPAGKGNKYREINTPITLPSGGILEGQANLRNARTGNPQ